jgi:site-specific DNA recombinase
VADLAPLVKTLERGGCQLVSLGESLDTTTAAGRLMLNLLVSVSQWEREAIGERTSTALRHMRDSRQAYNHTPLGFQRDGQKLIEDVLEQITARRIVTLRREGFSMGQDCTRFQRRGCQDQARWALVRLDG